MLAEFIQDSSAKLNCYNISKLTPKLLEINSCHPKKIIL